MPLLGRAAMLLGFDVGQLRPRARLPAATANALYRQQAYALTEREALQPE